MKFFLHSRFPSRTLHSKFFQKTLILALEENSVLFCQNEFFPRLCTSEMFRIFELLFEIDTVTQNNKHILFAVIYTIAKIILKERITEDRECLCAQKYICYVKKMQNHFCDAE